MECWKISKSKNKETNTTLDYYNRNAISYNEETFSLQFEEKQNILIKYLKQGDHILDLGCGSGRDSKAFLEKGYKVTSIDGSIELCKIASRNIGQEVICKNFQNLDEDSVYDAIWACASLIHVPSIELHKIMINILKALKSGGHLYASFKYGDFEGEKDGRYFTYFKKDSFKRFIENIDGLKLIELLITEDIRVGRKNEKWLNIILKKQ